jgi:hypothetical protein
MQRRTFIPALDSIRAVTDQGDTLSPALYWSTLLLKLQMRADWASPATKQMDEPSMCIYYGAASHQNNHFSANDMRQYNVKHPIRDTPSKPGNIGILGAPGLPQLSPAC